MYDYRKKSVFDLFSKRVESSFKKYCDNHGLNFAVEEFITYLIDQKLIKDKEIFRFVIQSLTIELLKNHTIKKTEVVQILAERFDVTPRTIWNILKTKT